MSDYPTTAPLLPPKVSGVASVQGAEPNSFYSVDFDECTCTCPHGQAWEYVSKKWVAKNFCNHKLKALASIAEKTEDPGIYAFYEEMLGKRLNVWNSISAFHKELRRGDANAAMYWAMAIIPHRGKHGVVAYMRNILFEETRDINLAKYILKISSMGKSVSLLDMQRCVRRFAAAPKKWELPWRLDIFLDEMRGYRLLANEYSYDVAKGKDILPDKSRPHLQSKMHEGFKLGERWQVQYGLKGWFKSKSANHELMKIEILHDLIDIMNDDLPNAFDYDHDYAMEMHKILMLRIRNHGQVGYHELNALADALTGEPGASPLATLTSGSHKIYTAHPSVYRVPLRAGIKNAPLYAHDNHTWTGKAKMKQHPTQLRPGALQTDLDFRLCGAYLGVAWRYLAVNQHAAIDCKWGDVSWSKPSWLWTHLDSMWY